MISLVLRAITLAMGIAVIVLSLLRALDLNSGFTLIGIGLASAGIAMLRNQ